MLSIRLSRKGKNKKPTYRLILQEKNKDPQARAKEILGFYNPLTLPKQVNFKNERILYWLSQGVKTSLTVHNLLVDQGIIKDKKVRSLKINKKKERGKVEETKKTKKVESQKEIKDEKVVENTNQKK